MQIKFYAGILDLKGQNIGKTRPILAIQCDYSIAQWVEGLGNRRVEYWAIRSSADLFACSALLTLLAHFAALIGSLALELMEKKLLSTN